MESFQVVDRKLIPVLTHLEELNLVHKGVGALEGQSLDLDEDLLFGEVLVVQAAGAISRSWLKQAQRLYTQFLCSLSLVYRLYLSQMDFHLSHSWSIWFMFSLGTSAFCALVAHGASRILWDSR